MLDSAVRAYLVWEETARWSSKLAASVALLLAVSGSSHCPTDSAFGRVRILEHSHGHRCVQSQLPRVPLTLPEAESHA